MYQNYLFSVEQKNVTQGLRTLLSVEEGRYMASEKQVSNSRSSSILKRISGKSIEVDRKSLPGKNEGINALMLCLAKHSCTQPDDSPIQIMDVVERGGLCEAHTCLPDVFTAVYRLHVLY